MKTKISKGFNISPIDGNNEFHLDVQAYHGGLGFTQHFYISLEEAIKLRDVLNEQISTTEKGSKINTIEDAKKEIAGKIKCSDIIGYAIGSDEKGQFISVLIKHNALVNLPATFYGYRIICKMSGEVNIQDRGKNKKLNRVL